MKLCVIILIYFTICVFKADSVNRNPNDAILENTKLIMEYLNESRLELDQRIDELKTGLDWSTVIRRQDGSVDFCRNWYEYREGFGDQPDGEFFIGLEKLHHMTSSMPCEALIILKDWNDEMRYAHYDLIKVDGEKSKYTLSTVGNYSGDAGDALSYHQGMKFSTFDQDNDGSQDHCAKKWKGGWWFNSCYACNLNGPYRTEKYSKQRGIGWYYWNGNDYSYKFAEMKIRPKSYWLYQPED